MNARSPTTSAATPASSTDWIRRFNELDGVLHHVQSLADIAYEILSEGIGREDITRPFEISERDANSVIALLRAIENSIHPALEANR